MKWMIRPPPRTNRLLLPKHPVYPALPRQSSNSKITAPRLA